MKTKEEILEIEKGVYTNGELNELEIMTDDLIIGIFDTKDKRYWINKMLRRAFNLGRKRKMKSKKEGREEIIKAIKFELAKGQHTFTMCECGRHGARGNMCWECLLDILGEEK